MSKKISFTKDIGSSKKDKDFNETIKIKKSLNVKELFKIKNNIFYKIPKQGKKSHTSLILDSEAFLNNYQDIRDSRINQLIEDINSLEAELNELETPEVDSNPFFPNNTFIRSSVVNTQGLPIWIMIKGARREFKNYNVYKTAKLALGFSENDSDLNIAQEVSEDMLDNIPAGANINSDQDLALIDRRGVEGTIQDFNPNDVAEFYSLSAKCYERETYDNNGVCSIKYYNRLGVVQEVEFPLGGILSNNLYDEPGAFTVGPRLEFQADPNSSLQFGLIEAKGYIRLYKGNDTFHLNPPTDEELGGPPQYSSYGTRKFTQPPPDGDGFTYDDKGVDLSTLFSKVFNKSNSIYYNKDATHKFDGKKEKGRGGDVYGAPILRYDNRYIVELKSTKSETFDRVYYIDVVTGEVLRTSIKKWKKANLHKPTYSNGRLKYDPARVNNGFSKIGYTFNRNGNQHSSLS